MLHAQAAQRAQKRRLRKALLRGQAGRIVGVGVILLTGQHQQLAFPQALRPAGAVKVAQHQIRHKPQPPGVVPTSVAGDHIIARLPAAAQFFAHRASGQNQAAIGLFHTASLLVLSGPLRTGGRPGCKKPPLRQGLGSAPRLNGGFVVFVLGAAQRSSHSFTCLASSYMAA